MIEKDGVVAKQEDLVDDNSIKVNNISENVKDGCEGAVQAPSVPQTQSQQSQGATVCWERFLHIRSLKVLLVEYDDSTRHVVAALLRNCSYEVIEAANGLQAWKILEDLANHVDLVLTEVVMPGLSGVGLLCKIMSHKTRKTVPVIMMSSLDSMGLVFKCLSKGAVDFLVKPIRKNELKNLWQHVWRRCHSSSGSGSESGTQTQKSVRSKSVDKADNNAGSSDEDDNGSIGVNAGDGSSTQSSWTKQAVEVDSPRMSTPDRVAECPDSTCAQVIHSNAEISGNKGVPVTVAKEFQEHVEQLDSIAIVREGEHRSLDLQQYPKEVPLKLISTKQNHSEFDEPIDEKKWDLNIESPSRKQNPKLTDPSRKQNPKLTDPSGVTTKTTESGKDNTTNETSTRISKILDINAKATEDVKKLPSVELSLKRSRGVEDTDVTIQDDRNVLRRSNSSAFLRYNTASNLNKGSSGNIENASQVNNNLETTRKGSILDVRSHAYSNLHNRSSNARSNNMDMGNTTDNCLIKPVVLKKSEVTCTVNCFHPSSAFQAQPMKSECRNNHQVVLEKGDDAAATTSRGKQQKQLQFQHLMRHYDNCHHLLCSNQQSQLPDDQDNISLKRMAAAVPQSGSSNVLGGLVEGNAANYSVNGSASGSNHGSNGPNGSSTAVNGKGMNMESDNGASGRSGSSNASESGSGRGNRVDQNKFAHQEASLTKFRQKRKERCFRKKVRYQSRKKLAEQRQCVQGPFVRQNVNENSSREGES